MKNYDDNEIVAVETTLAPADIRTLLPTLPPAAVVALLLKLNPEGLYNVLNHDIPCEEATGSVHTVKKTGITMSPNGTIFIGRTVEKYKVQSVKFHCEDSAGTLLDKLIKGDTDD